MTTNVGRSINLTLSTRGFNALELIGLKKELLDISIPMIGRMIHDANGVTNLQRYGNSDSDVRIIFIIGHSHFVTWLVEL